jgi:hypothetical protein
MENPASQPITAPPNTVTFYDIANSQTISGAQLQTTPKANVTYTLSCDASKDALYIIPYRAEAVYKDANGNYYQLQVAEMFIYNITTGKFSSTVLAGEEQNAGTTAPTSLLNYPAATSVEEGLGVLAFQYYDGTNYYGYINTTKVNTNGPTAATDDELSSALATIEAVGFPEAVVVKFSDGSNDYYALVKSDGTVSTSPQVNGFTTADELVAYKNNYYIRSRTSLYAVTLDLTNNAVTFTKIATVYSAETFNFTLPGMGLDGIAGVSVIGIAPIYSISGDISSFVPIQVVIANATNVAALSSYMPSENSFALYYTNSTDNNLYVAFMKISGANMVKGTSTTTTIKQEYITTVTTTQVPFPLILAPFGYFLRKRKKE